MNWKFLLRLAIPMIQEAGISKKAEDSNNTGRDDLIGASLVYAADLLDAILSDKATMPKAPAGLR